ncbi:hypothetical protein ACFQMM_03320 [Saliphagus sp. GCM10025308]|uniref:Uncharacterized protein n=1 Tax=Natronosalvus rutilus TaxID=2953753 RepID=A0A9E7N662_9EURY|nr:hypothetical protein [Natronosalvus rutilus]UTF52457.1 hypothetical protein NGM29_11720 [Natronosalvus rutilus]
MTGKYDKSFLEHLCDYEQGWRFLFTFSVGFLGLSVLWLVAADPGSPTYVVTVMNVVGLSILSLLSGFVLTRCR